MFAVSALYADAGTSDYSPVSLAIKDLFTVLLDHHAAFSSPHSASPSSSSHGKPSAAQILKERRQAGESLTEKGRDRVVVVNEPHHQNNKSQEATHGPPATSDQKGEKGKAHVTAPGITQPTLRAFPGKSTTAEAPHVLKSAGSPVSPLGSTPSVIRSRRVLRRAVDFHFDGKLPTSELVAEFSSVCRRENSLRTADPLSFGERLLRLCIRFMLRDATDFVRESQWWSTWESTTPAQRRLTPREFGRVSPKEETLELQSWTEYPTVDLLAQLIGGLIDDGINFERWEQFIRYGTSPKNSLDADFFFGSGNMTDCWLPRPYLTFGEKAAKPIRRVRGFQVDDVVIGSVAHKAGIVPFCDFVLEVNRHPLKGSCVTLKRALKPNSEAEVLVYSIRTSTLRRVLLHLGPASDVLPQQQQQQPMKANMNGSGSDDPSPGQRAAPGGDGGAPLPLDQTGTGTGQVSNVSYRFPESRLNQSEFIPSIGLSLRYTAAEDCLKQILIVDTKPKEVSAQVVQEGDYVVGLRVDSHGPYQSNREDDPLFRSATSFCVENPLHVYTQRQSDYHSRWNGARGGPIWLLLFDRERNLVKEVETNLQQLRGLHCHNSRLPPAQTLELPKFIRIHRSTSMFQNSRTEAPKDGTADSPSTLSPRTPWLKFDAEHDGRRRVTDRERAETFGYVGSGVISLTRPISWEGFNGATHNSSIVRTSSVIGLTFIYSPVFSVGVAQRTEVVLNRGASMTEALPHRAQVIVLAILSMNFVVARVIEPKNRVVILNTEDIVDNLDITVFQLLREQTFETNLRAVVQDGIRYMSFVNVEKDICLEITPNGHVENIATWPRQHGDDELMREGTLGIDVDLEPHMNLGFDLGLFLWLLREGQQKQLLRIFSDERFASLQPLTHLVQVLTDPKEASPSEKKKFNKMVLLEISLKKDQSSRKARLSGEGWGAKLYELLCTDDSFRLLSYLRRFEYHEDEVSPGFRAGWGATPGFPAQSPSAFHAAAAGSGSSPGSAGRPHTDTSPQFPHFPALDWALPPAVEGPPIDLLPSSIIGLVLVSDAVGSLGYRCALLDVVMEAFGVSDPLDAIRRLLGTSIAHDPVLLRILSSAFLSVAMRQEKVNGELISKLKENLIQNTSSFDLNQIAARSGAILVPEARNFLGLVKGPSRPMGKSEYELLFLYGLERMSFQRTDDVVRWVLKDAHETLKSDEPMYLFPSPSVIIGAQSSSTGQLALPAQGSQLDLTLLMQQSSSAPPKFRLQYAVPEAELRLLLDMVHPQHREPWTLNLCSELYRLKALDLLAIVLDHKSTNLEKLLVSGVLRRIPFCKRIGEIVLEFSRLLENASKQTYNNLLHIEAIDDVWLPSRLCLHSNVRGQVRYPEHPLRHPIHFFLNSSLRQSVSSVDFTEEGRMFWDAPNGVVGTLGDSIRLPHFGILSFELRECDSSKLDLEELTFGPWTNFFPELFPSINFPRLPSDFRFVYPWCESDPASGRCCCKWRLRTETGASFVLPEEELQHTGGFVFYFGDEIVGVYQAQRLSSTSGARNQVGVEFDGPLLLPESASWNVEVEMTNLPYPEGNFSMDTGPFSPLRGYFAEELVKLDCYFPSKPDRAQLDRFVWLGSEKLAPYGGFAFRVSPGLGPRHTHSWGKKHTYFVGFPLRTPVVDPNVDDWNLKIALAIVKELNTPENAGRWPFAYTSCPEGNPAEGSYADRFEKRYFSVLQPQNILRSTPLQLAVRMHCVPVLQEMLSHPLSHSLWQKVPSTLSGDPTMAYSNALLLEAIRLLAINPTILRKLPQSDKPETRLSRLKFVSLKQVLDISALQSRIGVREDPNPMTQFESLLDEIESLHQGNRSAPDAETMRESLKRILAQLVVCSKEDTELRIRMGDEAVQKTLEDPASRKLLEDLRLGPKEVEKSLLQFENIKNRILELLQAKLIHFDTFDEVYYVTDSGKKLILAGSRWCRVDSADEQAPPQEASFYRFVGPVENLAPKLQPQFGQDAVDDPEEFSRMPLKLLRHGAFLYFNQRRDLVAVQVILPTPKGEPIPGTDQLYLGAAIPGVNLPELSFVGRCPLYIQRLRKPTRRHSTVATPSGTLRNRRASLPRLGYHEDLSWDYLPPTAGLPYTLPSGAFVVDSKEQGEGKRIYPVLQEVRKWSLGHLLRPKNKRFPQQPAASRAAIVAALVKASLVSEMDRFGLYSSNGLIDVTAFVLLLQYGLQDCLINSIQLVKERILQKSGRSLENWMLECPGNRVAVELPFGVLDRRGFQTTWIEDSGLSLSHWAALIGNEELRIKLLSDEEVTIHRALIVTQVLHRTTLHYAVYAANDREVERVLSKMHAADRLLLCSAREKATHHFLPKEDLLNDSELVTSPASPLRALGDDDDHAFAAEPSSVFAANTSAGPDFDDEHVQAEGADTGPTPLHIAVLLGPRYGLTLLEKFMEFGAEPGLEACIDSKDETVAPSVFDLALVRRHVRLTAAGEPTTEEREGGHMTFVKPLYDSSPMVQDLVDTEAYKQASFFMVISLTVLVAFILNYLSITGTTLEYDSVSALTSALTPATAPTDFPTLLNYYQSTLFPAIDRVDGGTLASLGLVPCGGVFFSLLFSATMSLNFTEFLTNQSTSGSWPNFFSLNSTQQRKWLNVLDASAGPKGSTFSLATQQTHALQDGRNWLFVRPNPKTKSLNDEVVQLASQYLEGWWKAASVDAFTGESGISLAYATFYHPGTWTMLSVVCGLESLAGGTQNFLVRALPVPVGSIRYQAGPRFVTLFVFRVLSDIYLWMVMLGLIVAVIARVRTYSRHPRRSTLMHAAALLLPCATLIIFISCYLVLFTEESATVNALSDKSLLPTDYLTARWAEERHDGDQWMHLLQVVDNYISYKQILGWAAFLSANFLLFSSILLPVVGPTLGRLRVFGEPEVVLFFFVVLAIAVSFAIMWFIALGYENANYSLPRLAFLSAFDSVAQGWDSPSMGGFASGFLVTVRVGFYFYIEYALGIVLWIVVWGAFDKDQVRVQAWWLRLIEARRLGYLFLTFRKPRTFLERLKSTVLHHRDPAVESEMDYASTEKLMALEERNRQVSV